MFWDFWVDSDKETGQLYLLILLRVVYCLILLRSKVNWMKWIWTSFWVRRFVGCNEL